jgi:hypothetical protein
MNNTVIKVLNKEHGKNVIDWFNAQGINTNGYSGYVNEEDGGNAIYYGVIDSFFSNYNKKEVDKKKAKIITLPILEGGYLHLCNKMFKPGMRVQSVVGSDAVIDDTPFRYGHGERVYANDGGICLYQPQDNTFATILEEFDMSTNEGRLLYAQKYYNIGTEIYNHTGQYRKIVGEPKRFGKGCIEAEAIDEYGSTGYFPDIYTEEKGWCKIIEKENNAEAEEKFDLTTNAGKLAYAAKHYPVGTRYISPEFSSTVYTVGKAVKGTQYWVGTGTYKDSVVAHSGGDIQSGQFICYLGRWAEIIKEEEKMETQRLSRKGLKEIHSIACTAWKSTLEEWGNTNPLEDYIELTQEQVNNMFKACTATQLSIVSKYLTEDDGSVDVSNVTYNHNGALWGCKYLIRHNAITSIKNSFWLNPDFNWEVKMNGDTPFLVPTKKKKL